MPHRDSVTTEELKDLVNDVFGKPKVSRIKEIQKAEKVKTELKQEIAAWYLKHAKQYVFEFNQPGEDWGSL
jgi:hypothetical protein